MTEKREFEITVQLFVWVEAKSPDEAVKLVERAYKSRPKAVPEIKGVTMKWDFGE